MLRIHEIVRGLLNADTISEVEAIAIIGAMEIMSDKIKQTTNAQAIFIRHYGTMGLEAFNALTEEN